MSKILIVDHSEGLRREFTLRLRKIGYEVVSASSGESAISKVLQFFPDVIFLDAEMPRMNGFETLREIRSYSEFSGVPILIMSSNGSKEGVVNAFKRGASDYVVKPLEIGVVLGKLAVWLNTTVEEHWGELDPAVAQALRLVKVTMEEGFDAARNSRPLPMSNITGACNVLYDAVEVAGPVGIINAVEGYNTTLFLHSLLVGIYMLLFSRCMGAWKEAVIPIVAGGLLHDVGSALIPANIMFKPDKLEPEEYDKVKQHVAYGVTILENTPDVPRVITGICRNHHERMDGKGYPAGLKGEEISLAARLAAIVETYAALTTKTVYREAFSKRETFKVMESAEGQLNKELLQEFENAVMSGFKPGKAN
jgi:response regulator RpfG family c-di-GMP phosphodiesterase